MDRRDFLHTSASATTGLLLSPWEGVGISSQYKPDNNDRFQLKLLATNWGFDGSVDEFCARVKKEGYDGIEIWWPDKQVEQDQLFAALKKYGLEAGFLTGGYESDYSAHLKTFGKAVDAAAKNKIHPPLYVNCHSGRDYFSYEQGKTFIEHTIALSAATGVKIYHETHRSRLLYSAPVARHYMDTIPGLRITFDVSHWCNVHESLLDDQRETLELALQRTDHIHARVGHAEGPQVNDPRAPEWESAVKAHFAWWDRIVEMKKKKGETLTVLMEFGPADYMPTLPYTRQPLADQWAINVYMMQLFKQRYPS